MTQFVIVNNVNTQLAAALPSSGAGSTTVTLASSTNLPTLTTGQIMPLTLNDAATGNYYEIVYVTAISGVTLTVTRAQEGTGALNWSIGDYAYCAPTAGTDATAYGNPNNPFAVAAATAENQAPQVAQIQSNGLTYAADTGTANAYAVALTPTPTLGRGTIIQFTAAHSNTGASTLAVNGGTAYPIWGSAHSPVQGGEIVAGGYVEVEYNPTLNSGNPAYVLLENTGGATQVAPATASQHATQFAQMLASASPLCSLAYTSSTTLTLSRVRTGLVYSPGYGIVTVPSGGITYTASGLTASTLYYVYLNPNSGSPTLTLSTTGHTTDASGVEVQTGNNALVLVGMAYALTTTTIESTVRSWAHDPGYAQTVGITSSSGTTSTTFTNLNTGYQIPFLNWAGEQVTCGFSVFGQVTSAGNGINNGISIDAAAPVDPTTGATPPAANENTALSASATKTGLTEGRHISYLYGSVSSSAVTASWPGGAAGAPRPSNSVAIPPRG